MQTQTIAATGYLIFGAAALPSFLYMYSSKNQKVRQYQIDLFHGIAKASTMWYCTTACGITELAFDNIKRFWN